MVRSARLWLGVFFVSVCRTTVGARPVAAQDIPADMQETAKRAVDKASDFALALRDGNHKAAYEYLHPEQRRDMSFVQFLDIAKLIKLQGFKNLVWKNFGVSKDQLSYRAVGAVETAEGGEAVVTVTLSEDGGEMYVASFRAKRPAKQ